MPAYYRNDAARAATYVTEETEKARKEAKDAAAVTLTAALSALVVPGATTARCLAAAAPVVCANAARFDGIVAVPAAVAPLLGGARRNVLEPAAVSALEAIAAAAAAAPAPAPARRDDDLDLADANISDGEASFTDDDDDDDDRDDDDSADEEIRMCIRDDEGAAPMDEDDDKHGCASSPDTVATDFFTGE